jgi:hypothetical protein
MQVGVAGVLVVAMRQKAFLLFSACVLLTCVFIIMLPATTRQHGLKTIVKVSFLRPQGWSQNQCCGSGSAFIWLSLVRIRSGNVNPDPGAWKFTKIYK